MLALPRNDFKKQEILSYIAQLFVINKKYSEEEVNIIIKDCDVDDYVMIRRELVNFNYLGKNSYEGSYWLKKKILSDEELAAIKNNQKCIEKSGFY